MAQSAIYDTIVISRVQISACAGSTAGPRQHRAAPSPLHSPIRSQRFTPRYRVPPRLSSRTGDFDRAKKTDRSKPLSYPLAILIGPP